MSGYGFSAAGVGQFLADVWHQYVDPPAKTTAVVCQEPAPATLSAVDSHKATHESETRQLAQFFDKLHALIDRPLGPLEAVSAYENSVEISNALRELDNVVMGKPSSTP